MKTPPLLLGAALLFWGWQTGHCLAGAVMAAVLEGARLIKARWDFTDEDFRRIWTFCALLLLGAALYAFTASGGPADLRGFLQNPSLATERNAGNASARTVASLIRWLPMIFFLFIAAQAFSSREGIPPETISVIMRLRWQKARKLGRPLPAARSVNISYPYFMLCLFAASFHSSEDQTFFWGLCVLLAWALWPHRSRRYGVAHLGGRAGGGHGAGLQRPAGRRRDLPAARELQRAVVLPRGRRRRGPDAEQDGAGPHWPAERLQQDRHSPGAQGRQPGADAAARSQLPHLERPGLVLRDCAGTSSRPSIEETNHTTWVLLPGKTNSAAVNLACYLPGRHALLPLPTGSGRLENLSAFVLQKNVPGRRARARGRGWSCSTRSTGPAPTIDSPGNTNEDLAVPPKESPTRSTR